MNRRAFTLLELTMSLAVVTLLLGALVSSMVVAARAYPKPDAAPEAAADLRRTIDLAAAEISLARTISAASSSRVTFTLADVTGDTVDETISYGWGGNAGDPIVRVENGVESTLVPHADGFTLEWITVPGTQTTSVSSEGAEELLARYTDQTDGVESLGLLDTVGQFVRPVLPTDATSWRVTRASLRLQRSGTINVGASMTLRGADATTEMPTTILATSVVTVLGAANTAATYSAPLTSGALAPGAGVWIAVTPILSVSLAAPTQTGVANPNAQFGKATGAAQPTLTSDRSMLYELYGRVTRPTPVTAVVTRASGVQIVVTPSTPGVPRVAAGATIVARPITVVTP